MPCVATVGRQMKTIRTYSELITFPSFRERYRYLRLCGSVGAETFGFDRWLNQIFYKSKEWKSVRDEVILRDSGRDLGVEGYEIFGRILIHHMNPITLDDIKVHRELLLNPEYLICTSHNTHNAIHYGDEALITSTPPERKANDTCPWKRQA